MTTESKTPDKGDTHLAVLKIEGKIEIPSDDEIRPELLLAAARKYSEQLQEILRKAKDSDGDGIPESVLNGADLGAVMGFSAGAHYGANTLSRSARKAVGAALGDLLMRKFEPNGKQNEEDAGGATKH